MACTCSGSSCGCSTVSGRRGPRGYPGAPGPPGEAAQVLQGAGAPTADPDPVDAYALYADTDPLGHWWVWTPGTPGSWADTGVQIAGSAGANGTNAFTVTSAVTTIPPAGGFMLVTVPPGENAWAVSGQVVYVESAGYFGVLNLVGTTQIALINLRNDTTGVYASNAVSGSLVVGSAISPGGIQGPAGDEGTAATIAIGTVTSVPNGDPATVTNVGTPEAAIFDFEIPIGDTGAAGHTPVVTAVTSNPTAAGGSDGDIRLYQPVGNNGYVTFYYKTGGTWTAGPTVLANRMLWFSTTTTTPNPANVAANVNDYGWAYDGSSLYFFICTAAGTPGTWSSTTMSLGGGGGVGNFQQVSDASPVLGSGRRTGNRIWTMERSIQYAPLDVNITSLLTTTLDTSYQWQRLSIQVVSFALNWTAVASGINCEWIFEFTNDSGAPTTITYTAGRWTKSPGVTQPVILAAGEVATIHCYQHQGLMNIAFVEQGVTAI